MKFAPNALAALLLFPGSIAAQEVIYRQATSGQSVETSKFSVRLEPVDNDVRFAVTLTNKESGLNMRHEFDGEGASDPAPFQLEFMRYCNIPVLLLTVEYPWRHHLPEFQRVLSTFAFRETDFKFIDVAFGPLTDIALADDTAYEPSDLEMLPPIGVRCLTDQGEETFEFFEQGTK